MTISINDDIGNVGAKTRKLSAGLFFSLAAIVSVLTLFTPTHASATFSQHNPIRIVVFGDSLTSGYQLNPDQAFGAVLERTLQAHGFHFVRVINMSVPGETTGGGVERVKSALLQDPDIFIFALGANDALRGIDPAKITYKNIHAILTPVYTRGIPILYLGMKAPPNMGRDYTYKFETMHRTMAKLFKAMFYPFLLEGVASNPELNLADGYHPNSAGVQVIVQNVYPYVEELVRWVIKKAEHEAKYNYK